VGGDAPLPFQHWLFKIKKKNLCQVDKQKIVMGFIAYFFCIGEFGHFEVFVSSFINYYFLF
jgi:hypothetical protein